MQLRIKQKLLNKNREKFFVENKKKKNGRRDMDGRECISVFTCMESPYYFLQQLSNELNS